MRALNDISKAADLQETQRGWVCLVHYYVSIFWSKTMNILKGLCMYTGVLHIIYTPK